MSRDRVQKFLDRLLQCHGYNENCIKLYTQSWTAGLRYIFLLRDGLQGDVGGVMITVYPRPCRPRTLGSYKRGDAAFHALTHADLERHRLVAGKTSSPSPLGRVGCINACGRMPRWAETMSDLACWKAWIGI